MFERLLGNNEIKSTLRRMIRNGRVPRSLLLAGPEGTGKREFAFELARAFVCVSKIDGEGCGECSACVRSEKFVFPAPDAKKEQFERVFFSDHTDVGTVIPCRNNVLVDSVRHLEREANFRPYEASARFFIVDDADKMNEAASNALLKTLEEPPPTSYIFLVTSRPDTLLQTIRSRCQILRFAPVDADEIAAFLVREQSISPDDAELVARLSAGSVGRARAFDLTRFRDQRAAMLGVIESASGSRPDFLGLLKSAETLGDAKFKDEFNERLESLQSLIHDIWTLRIGASADSIVNADVAADLSRLARSYEARRLAGWLVEIETLRERQVLNLNRKISADALFLGMTAG
jgi:DNA polymerase-3 subunit delta'